MIENVHSLTLTKEGIKKIREHYKHWYKNLEDHELYLLLYEFIPYGIYPISVVFRGFFKTLYYENEILLNNKPMQSYNDKLKLNYKSNVIIRLSDKSESRIAQDTFYVSSDEIFLELFDIKTQIFFHFWFKDDEKRDRIRNDIDWIIDNALFDINHAILNILKTYDENAIRLIKNICKNF